jgi:hypothetical protein
VPPSMAAAGLNDDGNDGDEADLRVLYKVT